MTRPAWGKHARRAWRLALLRTSPHPTPVSVGIGLSITAGFVATIRGLDLITISEPPATTRVVDGQMVPTINYALDYLGHTAWGYGFLAVGLLVLLATAMRRIIPLFMAHTLTAGVYIAYFIVLAQGLYEQGSWNGVRFLASALAGASYSVLRLVLLIADLRGREYEEEE